MGKHAIVLSRLEEERERIEREREKREKFGEFDKDVEEVPIGRRYTNTQFTKPLPGIFGGILILTLDARHSSAPKHDSNIKRWLVLHLGHSDYCRILSEQAFGV